MIQIDVRWESPGSRTVSSYAYRGIPLSVGHDVKHYGQPDLPLVTAKAKLSLTKRQQQMEQQQ